MNFTPSLFKDNERMSPESKILAELSAQSFLFHRDEIKRRPSASGTAAKSIVVSLAPAHNSNADWM